MNEPLPRDRRHLYVLDLDRTLFRTAEFADDLIAELLDSKLLSSQNYKLLYEGLRQPHTFDIVTALNEYGIPFDALAACAKGLGDTYLYRDSSVIQDLRQHMIITTGVNKAFQELKIEVANLASVRSLVLPSNKGEYLLQQTYRDSDGLVLPVFSEDARFEKIILVDDSYSVAAVVVDDDRINPVYIRREDAKYITDAKDVDPRIRTISSLAEL